LDSLRSREIFRGVYVVQVSGYDREQALELLRENYKGDPDINKIRITRSFSAPLQNGECFYTFFFRLDGKNNKRPPCPECKSINIISNGRTRWICGDCGRQFMKYPQQPKKPQPLYKPKR